MSHVNLDTSRLHRPRLIAESYDTMSVTLTGDFTISDEGPSLLSLHPGGADRNVFLPEISPAAGQMIAIANMGIELLTIIDASMTPVVSLPGGGSGFLVSYHHGWEFIAGSSGGGGVPDGDKFDINVTGVGSIWTIKPDTVTNAKMSDMPAGTVKGRAAGSGVGNPNDLNGTSLTELLDPFTAVLKGVVPPSGGGVTNFLRADGVFAAPVTAVPGGSVNNIQINDGAGNLAGDGDFTWDPVANILTVVGTINIGSGDTTLARVSPGVLSVEGVNLLTTATGQPIDPTLTALAAFNTPGLLTQIAPDSFAGRTIIGTANEIEVTNNDGVAGNPTIGLPNDVIIATSLTLANEGLHLLDTNSTHDLVVKPGSNLTADRIFTITTGDAARTLDISAADVTVSAFGATLLDDADAAAARTTLGAQAQDADLDAIAALATTAAGRSVLTIPDPNVDRAIIWDESAGAMIAAPIGDIQDEPAPAVGDFILGYAAGGGLIKINWSLVGTGGGGGGITIEDAQDAVGTILLDTATIDLIYDDAAPSISANVLDDSITFAKLQNIATARFVGRLTAATGNAEELTGTQATTMLDVFTNVLKGLVPASGGGTSAFLRADGTWTTPPGGGGGLSDAYAAVTDGTVSAGASGGDTFKLRAGSGMTVAVQNNDATHGDNALFSLDATLVALAGYNTNGLLTQTAADTFVGRTLGGTAGQITVTNGDGVAGNPTFSLPADVLIPTVLTVPNGGLHLLDTNASHDLIVIPASNISADRNFSIVTGDRNQTVDYTDPGNQDTFWGWDDSADQWEALTAAEAAAIISGTNTFQPLDADLTSWAGVTRAAGFDTFAATPSSANLIALMTDETGTGACVFANTPTLVAPILGTPTSGTLTNCTGFPTANLAGLGTGVATFLATPSSANLAAAVTGETGSGALVFATSPALVTPDLGTPSAGNLANCTGLDSIVLANEAVDTTCFPLFATAATGELQPKTNAALTFDSATGALGMTTIELGHASDTTLARSSAGRVSVEGVNLIRTSDVASTSAAGINEWATTAEYLANTANLALETSQVNASGALSALTDAATVAVNMANGYNFSLLMTSGIGATRQLGDPSNTIVGRTGAIVVTQDASGSRALTYAGNWEFAAGTPPVLSTAANAKDILFYWVQSSTSIVITGILKGVA